MYLTKQEIFGQYAALQKTYDYLLGRRTEIKAFTNEHQFASLTFIGCGSSYCLCQSGEMSAKLRLGLPANALAAGDLLVNFAHYESLLQGTLLIAPSRSGDTSEVVMAVERAKELGVRCVSISAKESSRLAGIADLNLEIPWAFDESVCQTRTVSNLYTANLILLAIMADHDSLLQEIAEAIKLGDSFMESYRSLAKEIAQTEEWEKVVVLADSELQGIANEAAIAFSEIPQIPANYHHVLDVRHGPMVLVDERTLVLMACSPQESAQQASLIADLNGKGAKVVTIGNELKETWNSKWHVSVPKFKHFAVMGIPFIFIPQAIGYYKAIERGINPDLPQGLEPWIKLDETG